MFYSPGIGFEEDNGIIESADSAVPVVRIFGSTCSEKKACVHIHGVSILWCVYCSYARKFAGLFVLFMPVNCVAP